MHSEDSIFKRNIAQTSEFPLSLEIDRAEGIYLYDITGREYIDLISGISVSNIGHRHPRVVKAVRDQADKYLHVMVYGEYIQSPQVRYAKLLAENLPLELNCTYFVNSGSEAVEGALKLARRYTGRQGIVSCINAYHGSTHGALSVAGNENIKSPFMPLLPGVDFIRYNEPGDLGMIRDTSACVIIETVQGEAGVIAPSDDYLQKVRARCNETGALLILDEIQTGFGRTGTLFAFEQYGVIPDIVTFAKGMGGGMPLGAFVSSKKIMDSLKSKPALGHITTFGGHPVSCAAAKATLEVLLDEKIIVDVKRKSDLIRTLLKHKKILTVRGTGLLLAVQLENSNMVNKTIDLALSKGLIIDPFLFCDDSFRIAPPLIITDEEISKACRILLEVMEEV